MQAAVQMSGFFEEAVEVAERAEEQLQMARAGVERTHNMPRDCERWEVRKDWAEVNTVTGARREPGTGQEHGEAGGGEARVLELCRERLGPDFGLRIDPNGVWSVATATRIGQRLEPLGIEYFEDPAWGLEGNAAVRRAVRMPIATNMYPAKFDDLGPAIRLGAVDIVLTDIHYWEGPRGVKELAAVCRTFNLGVAMHSGAAFGIELAAMIHTASTIPEMRFAGDAHYHYLTDDIIEGGPMRYADGAIRVPTGPGLGVTLDEDKMAHYERYYEQVGDYYARFHVDPKRPDWMPMVGAL